METVQVLKKRNGLRYEVRSINGSGKVLAVVTSLESPEPVVRHNGKALPRFAVWFSFATNTATYLYTLPDFARTITIE